MLPDSEYVEWLMASQRGVLCRAQVLALGVTAQGLRYRIRPGGPWQRLLPGVYLTVTGEPTREQREVAALLYAGQPSVITGPAALLRHRIRGPATATVDVLVPARRERTIRRFAVPHRTRRMPRSWAVDLALRYALPARAVALLDGKFLARPDAWWPESAVAVEVDSREFHLLPEDWEQTMRRHRRMSAAGVSVLHLGPRQLRTEPRQVLADIAAALRVGHPAPRVTMRRPAA